MKDIAKLAVGLYQPVFAQESFYPIPRFLSGDACLQVDRPWVEVGMEALQFPDLLA